MNKKTRRRKHGYPLSHSVKSGHRLRYSLRRFFHCKSKENKQNKETVGNIGNRETTRNNERRYKKHNKRYLDRTMKIKRQRHMKGGYLSKKVTLMYENPVYKHENIDTSRLHQYLAKGYNIVDTNFNEMFGNIDESLALVKEGRTSGKAVTTPYFYEVRI